MGLFDIFKRRSKKAKEQKERESEKQKSLADSTTEAKAQQDETSDSSEVDQSSSSAQVDSDNEVKSSNSVEDSSSSEKVVESSTINGNESSTSEGSDSSEEAHPSSTNDNQQSSEGTEESFTSLSTSNSAPSSTSESFSSSTDNSSASQDSTNDVKSVESTPLSETNDESESSLASSSQDNSEADNKNDSSEAASVEESTDEDANDDEVEENAETEKFEHGLAKSRSSFGQKLNALFANFRSVDDDFFDDLEDTLIESDVGFDMAIKLTDQLREEVKLKNVKKAKEVQNVVIKKLIELYDEDGNGDVKIHFADQGPTVILFVGVNGVGKTTTIGKMANQYHQAGKKVLLAAADTFRAGAIQQLDVWAQRAHVDIVKKEAGSDPAAVVYEAVHKAKDEHYDVLFVDTAGRLQNKVNLMNELAKMKKVITREIPSAPQEILLVLDATTGQNALSQAKLFKETTDVTGIVLTKLDGSARGGIILAIRSELHIPVKLVGLGEKINDLRPFNANDYVYGLFKGLIN